MGDQFAAGLTGKTAPAGWMEIEAQENKHKDCNQVGKSGECLVVDGGYATTGVRAKKPWFGSVQAKVLSQSYRTETSRTFDQAGQPT